ncbi:MAG TPA: (2Fe-2S)-binding protein [Bacteroidota bacterium]|nr:(2Fe-2S)-binding protein [Bacteroidota bacterium]
MEENIRFTLNGVNTNLSVDPERTLLWVLRTDLGLTGTKYGCGEGLCGSCTVLIDGEPVRSCQILMKSISDRNILTIEGLGVNGKLHPIQQAFVDHDALQCGYCTPGIILTAYGLLKKTPKPSAAQIIDGMEDNLCRCGAHARIVAAIQSASVVMDGGNNHEK